MKKRIMQGRREFMGRLLGGAALLQTGSALPLLGLSGRALALAEEATDYRALVCVYLHGGNDSFNMLVPTASAAYRRYADTRGNMAVPREALLPIRPARPQALDYGLHPALEPLLQPFAKGDLAVVANLGTLLEPITREQAWRAPNRLPPQLFSHSDQTYQWQTGNPGGLEPLGWGGRMADRLQSLNGGAPLPMNITLAGESTFLAGEKVVQYALDAEGPERLEMLEDGVVAEALLQLLEAADEHILQRQFVRVQRRSIELQELLSQALERVPPPEVAFPDTPLGRQLEMVARMIDARGQFGLERGRQLFLVAKGGWDTHDRQNRDQPALLADLAACMSAFHQAMAQSGNGRAVTLFTASEFGRTLTSNGDGTDHGWGGHQMVLGGAVRGGDIYGEIPEMVVGGKDDLGDGRIIPTLSADQYSATLARWFGMPEGELEALFPRLNRFDTADLGFMEA